MREPPLPPRASQLRASQLRPSQLRLSLLRLSMLVSLIFCRHAAALGAVPPGEDDDSAALSLPSVSAADSAGSRAWSVTTEAALTSAASRLGAGQMQGERLTFDGRYDTMLAPGVRLVVADLLDLERQSGVADGQAIDTFKEGYLSWQPASGLVLDGGRINSRQGVALGYNPTDFFREGALRSVDSLDPDSLRQNRLGTAMLRGEALWNGGAFTAAFAPRLEGQPNTATFNPDFGATNHDNRWMLALSQRLPADLTPQLLVFGGADDATQFGVNLTHLVGSASVAYLEASAGRQASLWSQAGNGPLQKALRARVAAGVTYSTPIKLSVTLEYEYDGAALPGGEWNAVRSTDLPAYGRYRNVVSEQQDLATQHGAFVYVSWQDAGIRHLDLTAFLRADLVDHSTLPWLEARYHWTRLDAAIRWQNFAGGATSDYGASAQGRTWQAVLDYYL